VAIGTRRVFAHMHQGYWEDIGTIRSFYETNLKLTGSNPPFNFYDAKAPIYTHARFLQSRSLVLFAKMSGTTLFYRENHSL